MTTYWLGIPVTVITVYNRKLTPIGHIECAAVDEFDLGYYVDNRLARKFDINPGECFDSPEQILEIINGG